MEGQRTKIQHPDQYKNATAKKLLSGKDNEVF